MENTCSPFEKTKKITESFYENQAQAFFDYTKDLLDTNHLNYFSSLIPENGSILDAGCGSGRDANWFSEKGFKATAIDASSALIDLARKNFPKLDARVMDIMDLSSLPKESFEGIWFRAVPLHIPKDKAALLLKQLQPLLKFGGILFIVVKKGEGEKIVNDPRYSNSERYFSLYSQEQIEELLVNNGFKILKTDFDDFTMQGKYHNGDEFKIYCTKA
jgi:SAM-dependent methyltransferase